VGSWDEGTRGVSAASPWHPELAGAEDSSAVEEGLASRHGRARLSYRIVLHVISFMYQRRILCTLNGAVDF
jgi:hypothetical protein